MPRDGKAFVRTVVVLVAVLLSVLALRGYLPADHAGAPPPREPQRQDSSPVPVLVLFAVALAIMAFTALAAPRRRPRVPSAGEIPAGPGSSGGRSRRRFLLYAAAALLAWLTLILALPRWDVPVPSPDATSSETTPGATGAETERPAEPAGPGPLFGYVLAATIAMVVLSLAAALRNRTPGTATDLGPADDPAPVPTHSGGADLARATELGLAEIGDRSRDPRDAIIACYVAMETELDKSPSTSPQASDTPSEVLGRAVARRALRPGSAAELVDLFEEARFSPHVMTERHRAEALRALRAVQQELQDAL